MSKYVNSKGNEIAFTNIKPTNLVMPKKISQLDTKLTTNLYKDCGRSVRESNLICINALLNKLKIPGTTLNFRGRINDLLLLLLLLCYVMYFVGDRIFNSLAMYHYIFLILLQYLYITGYTPFGCPYSFSCCIIFVLNFTFWNYVNYIHHFIYWKFKNCTSWMTYHSLKWIINYKMTQVEDKWHRLKTNDT